MSLAFRIALLLGALWCVEPASAQPPPGTLAPPGNSGVSQYVETIPTHRGQSRARRGGEPVASPMPGTPGALAVSTRRLLRERGVDGRAVEQLHDQTRAPTDPEQADEVVRAARGQTAVIGTAVSRGTGGDLALPLLLVAIAGGGVLLWFGRRRRARP